MKSCSRCKAVKPFSEFSKDNTKRSGYHSHCKQCVNHNAKERKYQDNRRNKIYGITTQWYVSQMARQNNACAICETPCTTGRNLAVDHSHTTGKVRGLLCMACNTAIGKLGDNPAMAYKAYEYLKSFQGEG